MKFSVPIIQNMPEKDRFTLYFESLSDAMDSRHDWTSLTGTGRGCRFKPRSNVGRFWDLQRGESCYRAWFPARNIEVVAGLQIENSQALLDALLELKTEIESDFGDSLDWSRRLCRSPGTQNRKFIFASRRGSILAGDAPSVDEDPLMVLTGGKLSWSSVQNQSMISYSLGLVDYETGDFFAAITAFDKAIQLNPQYADAYVYRGLSKAGLGHNFEAIADYDAAIQLNPTDGIASLAYYCRGIAKNALEQYKTAIEDYDAAIRLKPDIADVYNSRGTAKFELGEYFGAIADFDTAIRLNPDDPKAYHNRGFAKENLGHSDAAGADYETAIRLKPNYDEAGNNRASAKSEVQGKNIEETISEGERMLQQLMAESNLEQSPAVSPESSEETKPELERNHAAPSSIDRAAQIDPNYDKAIYNGTLASHQVQSAF